MSESGSGYWVIVVTLLAAAILAVVPLDRSLAWWRPEWMLLVIIYWAIALPHRIGLFTAFTLGLLMDVLEGGTLGQHMLAMGIVVTLAKLMYQRLRMFSSAQQATVIFVLAGIHQLILQWLLGLQGLAVPGFAFLFPAITSALLWPLLMPFLRGVRRVYGVT